MNFLGGDACIFPLNLYSNIGPVSEIEPQTNSQQTNTELTITHTTQTTQITQEITKTNTQDETSKIDKPTHNVEKRTLDEMQQTTAESQTTTSTEETSPQSKKVKVEEKTETQEHVQQFTKTVKLDKRRVTTIVLQHDDIQRTGARCVEGEQQDLVNNLLFFFLFLFLQAFFII